MKKKFKTIITAVVLLAVAFMVTGCGSKGSTAGVGETLVAKGVIAKFTSLLYDCSI